MARDNKTAGRIKQTRGKANDIAGAITGDTTRQLKGKAQKVAGKIQEKLGRAKPARARTTRTTTTRTTTSRR